MLFALADILLSAALAAAIVAIGLYVWSWSRERRRFLTGALATFVGFTAWNLVLNATDASNFNVDAPVIGLSWADVGSGVMAMVANSLALGLLTDRGELAWRVMGAAALAGVLAMLVDLFVL